MKNSGLTPLSSSFVAIPFSLPRRIATSAAMTFLCAFIGLILGWVALGRSDAAALIEALLKTPFLDVTERLV